MLRHILGTALAIGLLGAASVASAVPIFDGTVTYLSTTGATCSTAGNSFTAIYRPQIGSTAPKSGLVWQLYRAGVGFTMAGNGQFNGTGIPFGTYTLTQQATIVQRTGIFTGTQTPASATGATQVIQLNGDFVPSAGCHHRVRGVFIRRPGT